MATRASSFTSAASSHSMIFKGGLNEASLPTTVDGGVEGAQQHLHQELFTTARRTSISDLSAIASTRRPNRSGMEDRDAPIPSSRKRITRSHHP